MPHCATDSGIPHPPTANPRACSDGYLDCGPLSSQRCIFESLACDGRKDCSNGNDELNCDNTTCTESKLLF